MNPLRTVLGKWTLVGATLLLGSMAGCLPQSAMEQVRQGDDCFENHDFDGALAHFSEAIRLDPKCAVAYNNRGVIYKDQGKFNKAIADFDAALHLEPTYADAFFNRAVAYVKQGDLDQAIADYSEVLRLKPDYVEAYVGRANAYQDLGDDVQAEADRNKAKVLGAELP